MKIAFLCPSISRTSGGIFEVERDLAQNLAKLPSTTMEVWGVGDRHTEEDLPQWKPIRPNYFPYLGPSSFRYSPRLERAFLEADADLAHTHALWTHNSIIVKNWAKRWHRPYLVTANGMLDAWAIRNSHWKKRLALSLYERKCLDGAACIHVTSEPEYNSVRKFGLSNPVCIIPNGVDLPDLWNAEKEPRREELPWANLINPGSKILLYLGRLHPKKGLTNLLKAWSQLSKTKDQPEDWALVIAGWDQEGHQSELQKLKFDLGLRNSVVFIGPQFGRAKTLCYRNCDVFVLPSFSEGLPMAVLEAWSYGKPVLMTAECNLSDGFSTNSAVQIEPSVDSIAEGLGRLFQMSAGERRNMGANGISLVRSTFTWTGVASQMRSVYSWIAGCGPKPPFVFE